MSQPKYYDRTSDNQPIGVKMRPDLQVQEILYQSEPWYVVKDPHDQQYYRYNEQEYAILNWLDGTVSFLELREKFERKFSPYRVSFHELTTLIREFFKKSVVVSTRGGNGLQLHEYSREKRREKAIKKAKNILAIQLNGWDPTRFIDATYSLVGWFFSKTMVRLNIVFFFAATLWLVYHYDQFLTRLPSLWSLLDSSNLISLALTIGLTKVLHELGHAYAHKRFGGECHEIGVMIFFFVPTLYCNTSDSWLFTDKRKRMAIGAAGVYVELVLCSVATFVWWFSGVGIVQDISLNLMVICSISAALTNGNPLMRYDGYFVLADWLETPNLAEQSGKEIRRQFLNRCLGVEREVDHWNTSFNKRVFLIYGIAAFLFKVLLISLISYLLIERFQSVGLASLGLVIAVISLGSLLLPPVKSMTDYFKQPGNRQHVRRRPLLVTAGVAAALLGTAIFVPLPFHVPAECTVELTGLQTVFAPHSARIDEVYVRPGQSVQQGQVIMQLANDDLDEQILGVETQLEELEVRLKHRLTPNQTDDVRVVATESAESLYTTRRKLVSELNVLQAQRESLLVQAPRDGQVYGLTIGKQEADTNDENLNRIYGNPLHDSNRGAWLERGEEICRIGDDAESELTLLVEQRQNSLIHPGQDVSILLASLSQRLPGRIEAISLRENHASDLPEPIYASSSSPTVTFVKQAASANQRKDIEFKDGQTLASTMVQATVKLTGPEQHRLNFASVGKARIFVGHRTLLWRAKHVVDELFQQSF